MMLHHYNCLLFNIIAQTTTERACDAEQKNNVKREFGQKNTESEG